VSVALSLPPTPISALRVLPHDHKAESDVLGAILIKPASFDEVAAVLEVDDFGLPVHREIFEATVALRARAVPLDITTIADELKTRGMLARLEGGESYLLAMANAVPTAENVLHYARIVREKATVRRLAAAAAEIQSGACGDFGEFEPFLEAAKAKIDRVVERSPAQRTLPPFAADQAIAAWAQPLPSMVATGIAPLDGLLGGGLEVESVYVLCAGTGKGKTGFAIQLARSMASERSVVYFTSEIPSRQILARSAAQVLRRPWRELNRLPPEVGGSLISRTLKGLRLRVIELRRDTDIIGVLNQIARVDGEAPVLFLDYLQHAARRENPDDRRIATAALSDVVTSWARDTKSLGFVVSSVSRNQYGSDGDRLASDYVGTAKESGDVDFDAAGILFLDTVTDGVTPGATTTARLHVAKSRFAVTGTIGLAFDGAIGLFTSDPTGALTAGQQEILDAIQDGATTAVDVARAIQRRKADVLTTIASLRSRGLIGVRPLRVLQQPAPAGSRLGTSDGDDRDISTPSGTGNFSVPTGSRNRFSDGEPGSGLGNPPSGGTLGSLPVGEAREPSDDEEVIR
jgi:replicative DNA helicase